MVVIGLTGNIGAGKSRVMAWLQKKGALALDADRLAHEVMLPGMPAHAQIVERFGPQILDDEGRIDRAALGAVVFANRERLAELEAIVHPEVFRLAQERMRESRAPVTVIEAIKLLESGRILRLCDEVWVVTASEQTILQRLVRDRGMSVEEARRRLAAQMPQAGMVQQATRVIANDGSLEELYAAMESVWSEFAAKYALVPSDAV